MTHLLYTLPNAGLHGICCQRGKQMVAAGCTCNRVQPGDRLVSGIPNAASSLRIKRNQDMRMSMKAKTLELVYQDRASRCADEIVAINFIFDFNVTQLQRLYGDDLHSVDDERRRRAAGQHIANMEYERDAYRKATDRMLLGCRMVKEARP